MTYLSQNEVRAPWAPALNQKMFWLIKSSWWLVVSNMVLFFDKALSDQSSDLHSLIQGLISLNWWLGRSQVPSHSLVPFLSHVTRQNGWMIKLKTGEWSGKYTENRLKVGISQNDSLEVIIFKQEDPRRECEQRPPLPSPKEPAGYCAHL